MNLTIHIPTEDELWYRQHLVADEATMSYNMGYGDGGGCTYERTLEELQGWYRNWNNEKRFYAYIQREDGVFVGDVDLYQPTVFSWFEMGIVIEAKYRGMGYGTKAMPLLLDHAFDKMHAPAVHNSFEDTRASAMKLHLHAGFCEISRQNGIVDFLMTREEYETVT